MQRTSIEWTDCSANPIRARRRDTGKRGHACVMFSPGCLHCYSHRWNKWVGTGLDYDRHAADLVELYFDDRPMRALMRIREPQRVFVCDMTDLGWDKVPDGYLDRIFAYAALMPQHTLQILTKRADRLARYLLTPGRCGSWGTPALEIARVAGLCQSPRESRWLEIRERIVGAPLPNVWVGFSAENQTCFDERWEPMRAAAEAGWLTWCSAEPLLGPIDARKALAEGLAWIVAGGESGPKARPMHPGWARWLRDQCARAGAPFFFKQWGGWGPWSEDAGPSPIGHKAGFFTHTGVWHEGEINAFRQSMTRVGKKAAGRVLDGRTWDEFPGALSAATAGKGA